MGSDCDFLVYCVILYINIYDRKSFDYETSITGKLEKNDGGKGIKIAITLNHLSNFCIRYTID